MQLWDISEIWVKTESGEMVQVVPIAQAAEMLNYTHRWTQLRCDMGQLISIKISGRWFVSIESINRFIRLRDGLRRAC